MRMRSINAAVGRQSQAGSTDEVVCAGNSWATGAGSGVTSRTRRRGSAVTFDLPDERETDVFNPWSSAYRRMSAPELPPIADPDPRAKRGSAGSSTGKSSFYSRMKNGTRLPRNHSDSSLKGYLARSPNSQSSSSASSHPSGIPGYLTSRAKSWCATDQSTGGSTTKLETLFERKSNMSVSSPRYSTVNVHQRRCVSQDRSQSRSEITNDSEIVPIDEFSRQSTFVLRRSVSQNKLKNQNNSHLDNRTLSVGKTSTLTKPRNRNGFSYRMKRFHSTPAINGTRSNTTDRDSDEHLKKTDLEDGNESENETEKFERIFDWLRAVECSAEEPPETVIEYSDEPPQTDTAVHIVYNGD